MVSTMIAVIGTLMGAVVSGLFQHRSAGRTEAVARLAQLRQDKLEAVTALAVAISDHRSAMWARGDAQLKADPADRIRDLKVRTHETRAAVTRPLVVLRLLVPNSDVRRAADEMVASTYAMRDAFTTTADLTAARQTAVEAHDQFVAVAAHSLNLA
ncbi:hypothetical protein ACIRU8_45775 [Streptomyces sp. NPDC101175]|uniref:hypothetical protein n=1 Tax=Streptomyces sp. NPDC101175 TaxID=3366123 RepID=UPI003835F66D